MTRLTRIVMSVLLTSTITLLNSASFADPGNAQGHGGGKGHGKAQVKAHTPKMHGGKNNHIKSSNSAVKKASGSKNFTKFSPSQRTAITHYFNAHPLSANSLPPGIAMNLARGKPLPPGIAKKYFPNDLLAALPTYPGSEYLLVGRDAVLVNSTTGMVMDVIANVLK